MKIPSSIKIAGHTVTVVPQHEFIERRDIRGHVDFERNEILLMGDTQGTRSESDQAETLLHEILHHVDWRYNAGKLDEDTTARLSEGLYQVLKDNKLKFFNE